MSLAHRVIPVVLYRGSTALKGQQFNSWRSIGSVIAQAEVYAARGVDEAIFLDIGATPEGRGPDLKLVEQITRACFSPVTVGGGIRSVQDVRDLLNAGADKAAICTNYQIIPEAAEKFGAQAIVMAADCDPVGLPYVRCGREQQNSTSLYILNACLLHAGEILLTSIDREGMMAGYDLDLIRTVSQAVSIPVIANGGCGTPQHMLEAIQAGADAVAAGAMFAFTDTTPKDCARFLADNNVEVRV